MIYPFLQIISIIFSFSSSFYELYRTVDAKSITYHTFILYGMRIMSSGMSSIYYTVNDVNMLMSLNVYKSFGIHCIIIICKIYYLYNSKYNAKKKK